MKRQIGAVWIAGMLLCASAAWSQSDSAGSSQSGSSSSSQSGSSSSPGTGSSSSSEGGFSSSTQAGSAGTSQAGASGPVHSGFTSQTLFTSTTPTAWTDPGQNGSGDPGQSGSGDPGQSGGGDNGQSGTIGPQDTFKHFEQLPALDLFSDAVSHTGLSLNTTVGSSIQHVSTTGFGDYTQLLSSFGGGVSIAQSRPDYGFVLGYDTGVNLTSGAGYNSTNLNQNAHGTVTWNFAKRWQLRLRDAYLYSDDPFQPFFTYLGQPTPNNPNPVTYFPNAVIEQNVAHADLTYQLGPHDIVNFTGDEGFNRYLRQDITSLYDSVSYAGGMFYQHTFTERLAAGGGYQFAALDFGHGQSRAGVQTFEGFIEYVFNSRMQGSLWIGPELTATKDVIPVFCSPYGCFVQVFHQSSWSVAQGGTFQYRFSQRDQLSIQGSHGVSNAGGFLGAASIYQATATYGRPIGRVWALGAALGYSDSKSVSQFRADQVLRSITGTVGVSRKLFNSDAWTVNAYYAIVHQTQNYSGVPLTVGTNGLGFTIRYVWDHALGIGR